MIWHIPSEMKFQIISLVDVWRVPLGMLYPICSVLFWGPWFNHKECASIHPKMIMQKMATKTKT
jgi:hypothetical protein